MTIPLSTLIVALIFVESHGDDKAFNAKEKAYGCLQVRSAVIKDVNARYHTAYTLNDMFNRDMAITVCSLYLTIYVRADRLGREPEAEDYARIWVGGPNGWHKIDTVPYWQKVQKQLDKITK